MRPFAVLAAVIVAAGGCFAPQIEDGQVPCGPTGECPSGFRCQAGHCSRGGSSGADAALSSPDAAESDAPLAVDASGGVDGGTADGGVDATPDAAAGTVNITFLGSGAGTVSAGSVSCTATCSRAFPVGVAVSFTAMPMTGSLFAGWSGACSSSGACMVTPEAQPKTLEATFIPVATVQLITRSTGPGSLMVDPAGASCGTGCQAYATGTNIRITPVPDPGLSFISYMGAPCDQSPTDTCSFVINSNLSISGSFCPSNRVVDASTGSDTNDGTCARPFKTISKALSVATAGQLVSVRPGVYSAVLGESFPLKVPDGVSLIGDEAQKGGATRIQGGGAVDGSPGLRAAVVVGADATLAGFVILNPSSLAGSNGVVVTKATPNSADRATIRSNTVTNCGADGVYLERAKMAIIEDNVISDQDSGGVGLRITAEAGDATVGGNVIVRNTYGVEVHVDADLGGGGRSMGGNTLSCNVEVDVVASGEAAPILVSATTNRWDHTPPKDGCASTFDVCRTTATVTVSGATVAQSPCN